MPHKDPDDERAYRKEWRARPEVKAMTGERQRRYMSKPGVKEKWAKHKKQYDLTNQSKHRDHHLRREYNITLADWNALFAEQGMVCAMCGEDRPRMVVDHDHATGAVRGILCQRCNLSLRVLEDEALLAKAMAYLDKTATFPKYDVIAESVWESMPRENEPVQLGDRDPSRATAADRA